MSKSLKKLGLIVFVIPLLLTIAQCTGLLDAITDAALEGYDSLDDENNIESVVSGATEALTDSISSSTSAAASTVSSLTKGTDRLSLLLRYHCDDATSYEENFDCYNDTGTMTRTVTYTDCEVTAGTRDYTVNGSFTNAVTNGGDGFCNLATIDMANMVMGVEDAEEGHLDAVHTHETGTDGLIKTFSNGLDKEVTDTITAERTDTYTDAVDADGDDMADEVTVTVEKVVHREREIDGTLVHDMDITATSTSFGAQDEDGNAITVTVTNPVHRITFDDDGEIESREIQSGNLIVDHEIAGMRVVLSLDSLTFDDEHCGPVSGTMSLIAYELNDDDTIGQQIGEGTVTFEDGDVDTAEYDGTVIYPELRTCL